MTGSWVSVKHSGLSTMKNQSTQWRLPCRWCLLPAHLWFYTSWMEKVFQLLLRLRSLELLKLAASWLCSRFLTSAQGDLSYPLWPLPCMIKIVFLHRIRYPTYIVLRAREKSSRLGRGCCHATSAVPSIDRNASDVVYRSKCIRAAHATWVCRVLMCSIVIKAMLRAHNLGIQMRHRTRAPRGQQSTPTWPYSRRLEYLLRSQHFIVVTTLTGCQALATFFQSRLSRACLQVKAVMARRSNANPRTRFDLTLESISPPFSPYFRGCGKTRLYPRSTLQRSPESRRKPRLIIPSHWFPSHSSQICQQRMIKGRRWTRAVWGGRRAATARCLADYLERWWNSWEAGRSPSETHWAEPPDREHADGVPWAWRSSTEIALYGRSRCAHRSTLRPRTAQMWSFQSSWPSWRRYFLVGRAMHCWPWDWDYSLPRNWYRGFRR